MYDGKTVNKVINNKWLVQSTLEYYDIDKKKGYVTLYVADLGSQSGRLTAQSPMSLSLKPLPTKGFSAT